MGSEHRGLWEDSTVWKGWGKVVVVFCCWRWASVGLLRLMASSWRLLTQVVFVSCGLGLFVLRYTICVPNECYSVYSCLRANSLSSFE